MRKMFGNLTVNYHLSWQSIRMANLAIVCSHTVNGVSNVHSELLKTKLFRVICVPCISSFSPWLMIQLKMFKLLIYLKLGHLTPLLFHRTFMSCGLRNFSARLMVLRRYEVHNIYKFYARLMMWLYWKTFLTAHNIFKGCSNDALMRHGFIVRHWM